VLFELERRIPKDIYSEARLIEDCMRAVDFIGAVPTYQVKNHFTVVTNHKFCIPNDCLQIIQIAHRANPNLTDEELEEIQQMLQILPDTPIENSTLPEQVWRDNWQQKIGWTPLRLSTDSFALSVHCNDSRNISSTCSSSYTVSPDGTITTSCEKAYILMAYYAYPQDCDGTPLIPDVEDYKQALINYCMMNNWQYRWELKEEGAGERYKEYQMLWGLFKAKANASIRMPDAAQADNMMNISLKLIPNTRRFNNFYKGLGDSENLNLNGFSNGSLWRN
jgi:hypothetical protein